MIELFDDGMPEDSACRHGTSVLSAGMQNRVSVGSVETHHTSLRLPTKGQEEEHPINRISGILLIPHPVTGVESR